MSPRGTVAHRVVLEQDAWTPLASAHEARVDALLEAHRGRRSRGVKHPIEDFVFEYYSYRPSSLRRWHPGWGVELGGDVARFSGVRGFTVAAGTAHVDPGLPGRRRAEVARTLAILEATKGRPPSLGCFGLHEWAMVYRLAPGAARHPLPLRLGAEGTDTVVEQHRIACTHFDAFRFFSPDAVARNALIPTAEKRQRNEQPGCLHANMDVYKWAYKLTPFTSAELVADCFELARRIRVLDMRASPYDLSELGYSAVAIETAAGKAEYLAAQRAFAAEAAVLRNRLIELCQDVLGSL